MLRGDADFYSLELMEFLENCPHLVLYAIRFKNSASLVQLPRRIMKIPSIHPPDPFMGKFPTL